MKKIERRSLSAHAKKTLAKRQTLVNRHPNPQARARVLWGQRQNKAFREIRNVLNEMATGRNRCMYCEDNEGTDIEHFYPKSVYPDRAYVWGNYLIACSRCNSNYKRNQFPLTKNGEPLLIDPTKDDPEIHMSFTPTTGSLVARTRRGQCSIDICGLERQTLRQGRRDAWVALCGLIPTYTDNVRRGEFDRARDLKEAIARFPFASVFRHFIHVSQLPGAHLVIPIEVIKALGDSPEILTW